VIGEIEIIKENYKNFRESQEQKIAKVREEFEQQIGVITESSKHKIAEFTDQILHLNNEKMIF
jgi:hypothetical protein